MLLCCICIHHECPQAWVGGTPPGPGKVVKCFGALVMTVKCSVDKLFVHYFQNICQLLGLCLQTPFGARFMGPSGNGSRRLPNLPTHGKKILWRPMFLICFLL